MYLFEDNWIKLCWCKWTFDLVTYRHLFYHLFFVYTNLCHFFLLLLISFVVIYNMFETQMTCPSPIRKILLLLFLVIWNKPLHITCYLLVFLITGHYSFNIITSIFLLGDMSSILLRFMDIWTCSIMFCYYLTSF